MYLVTPLETAVRVSSKKMVRNVLTHNRSAGGIDHLQTDTVYLLEDD